MCPSFRQAVEWDYGVLGSDWAYTDIKIKQKIELSQVKSSYIVTFFLDKCLCQEEIILANISMLSADPR